MPPNDRPLHPGSACLPCRKRKAKCDGVRPMCARCRRLGSNCAFDPPNRSSHSTRTVSTDSSSERSPSQGEYFLSRRTSPTQGITPFQRLLAKLPDDARLDRITASFARPNLPIYLYRDGWESSLRTGTVTRTMYPEAYETLVPRTTIEAALRDWDTRYEPSPEVADYLIRLFLPFRRQFYFFVDVRRLLHGAYLPQSDPDAIHPALLNAIYLAACHVVKGDLSRYENIFLARARAYMDESLAQVDRLTHFLTASLLLSCWYAHSGRLVEAQSSVATTVQFGVACGLHDPSDTSASVMLPLADEIEMMDRRNLWYGITMADNCLAFGHGIPRYAPEKSISCIDYLANEALSDIFQYPSAVQIRTRANVLLFAVRQFNEESKSYPASPFLIGRGAQLSQILGTFANNLPPIDSPDGLAAGETTSLANPDFVIAHIDIFTATILLLNSRLEDEPLAYERIFKSACSIASLGKHIRSGGRLELIHASASYMLSVHTACEVLMRDLLRCGADPSPAASQRAAMVETMLEHLFNFEVELMVHFPARRWGLRKIRGILAGTDKFETI